MPTWLTTILAILGGGVGTKALDVLLFGARDRAQQRREIWSVVEDLKARVGTLEAELRTSREDQRRLLNENNGYRLANILLRHEVNEALGLSGRPARYAQLDAPAPAASIMPVAPPPAAKVPGIPGEE